jgi:hypothetical protein
MIYKSESGYPSNRRIVIDSNGDRHVLATSNTCVDSSKYEFAIINFRTRFPGYPMTLKNKEHVFDNVCVTGLTKQDLLEFAGEENICESVVRSETQFDLYTESITLLMRKEVFGFDLEYKAKVIPKDSPRYDHYFALYKDEINAIKKSQRITIGNHEYPIYHGDDYGVMSKVYINDENDILKETKNIKEDKDGHRIAYIYHDDIYLDFDYLKEHLNEIKQRDEAE